MAHQFRIIHITFTRDRDWRGRCLWSYHSQTEEGD
jgi:hypothetical protein